MKRIFTVFMSFTLLLSLSSCTKNSRPDLTTLSDKMAIINEKYAFDYFDAFIYDDAYHIYFSLCSEDDVLLSLHIDDNGNIDDVNILAYAEKMKNNDEKKAYMDFTCAVIDCFTELNEKEKSEKEKSLSYQKPELYFSDLYETFSALRYNFIFSSNSSYISLYCEYYEIMDNTDIA